MSRVGEIPPPPYLHAEFCAAFSSALAQSQSSWARLATDDFVRRLCRECGTGLPYFSELNPEAKRAIAVAFRTNSLDHEGKTPESLAAREFLEDCMVKLKRLLYGAEAAREVFDPRKEGEHKDAFNRSALFIQEIVARVESQLAQPRLCRICGAFGDRFVLATHEPKGSRCLVCDQEFRLLLTYYQYFLSQRVSSQPAVLGRASLSFAQITPLPATTSRSQKSKAYSRADLLGLCFQALARLDAASPWVRERAIVDQVRDALGGDALPPRAIRRELALHALGHPDRAKYVSKRLGRFLFEFRPPHEYRLLPEEIRGRAADSTEVNARSSRAEKAKGRYLMRADGRLVPGWPIGRHVPEDILWELQQFAERRVPAGGIMEVKPPALYRVVEEGRVQSSVLIGHMVRRADGRVALEE